MPQPPEKDQASTFQPSPLSIAAPARRPAPKPADAPDLRVEEIEERHIPKDRNIFDK
ncbi:MAG TPA: hypothetical protein VFY71_11505 [Planctomycetota bacterium]|nr:hypothetical protein [Planctomycetota bacterium]